MMNEYRYKLEVGYGDEQWDDGYDVFFANSLEELWSKIDTDLAFNEFIEMMNVEHYAADEDQMWYVIDLFMQKN